MFTHPPIKLSWYSIVATPEVASGNQRFRSLPQLDLRPALEHQPTRLHHRAADTGTGNGNMAEREEARGWTRTGNGNTEADGGGGRDWTWTENARPGSPHTVTIQH